MLLVEEHLSLNHAFSYMLALLSLVPRDCVKMLSLHLYLMVDCCSSTIKKGAVVLLVLQGQYLF